MENNHAFIDGNNLHQGTLTDGWEINYEKLRTYLYDKFSVSCGQFVNPIHCFLVNHFFFNFHFFVMYLRLWITYKVLGVNKRNKL